MQAKRMLWARYGLHAVLLGLAAYLIFGAVNRRSEARASVDDRVVRITGPYSHDNLAVYLIHSSVQDPRPFITLNEGLKSGAVKVAEQDDAQVNRLVIDNTSDQYLFLQEGDTIKGGKQDRTIYAGHIVPPHSGPQALPAFCVEPNRWVAGVKGGKFDVAVNDALAPKEVRQAAKYQASQGEVWAQVAVQRKLLSQNLNVELSATGSSLNEATEKPQVRNVANVFNEKLGWVLDLYPDAVGVAVAVNGDIEEINIYPNNGVLRKQFERLVGSYAVQAAMKRKEAKDPSANMTAQAVAGWMHDESNRRAAEIQMAQAGQPYGAYRGGDVQRLQLYLEGIQEQEQAIERLEQARDTLQSTTNAADGRQLQNSIQLQGRPAAVRMTREQAVTRQFATNTINASNSFTVQPLADKDKSVSYYEGKPVHTQFMKRSTPAAQPQPQRMINAEERQQAVPQQPAPNAPPQPAPR